MKIVTPKPEAPDIHYTESVCFNCVFYKHDDRTKDKGKCHYDPPKVFMIMAQSAIKNVASPTFLSSWPVTDVRDFCGKFSINEERIPRDE